MPKVSGLQPTKKDPRDYSYHKTFGASLQTDLPDEFLVANPLKIKDQKTTDLCGAFGSTEVAEDEDAVEFSPEWFFSKIKQLLGDYKGYGTDLRTPCRVATKFGFLEQKNAPFSLNDHDRDFVANWQNWSPTLDILALQHKKDSYFSVENFQNDWFDSIRVTLLNNKASKESILVGSDWYAEWNNAPGGVIPKESTFKVAQHIFKIFGWKKINGETYLIIQNSEGIEFGDNGLAYFSRETVNKEFGQYGMYCFVQGTPDKIKTVGNPLSTLLFSIVNFFVKLLKG